MIVPQGWVPHPLAAVSHALLDVLHVAGFFTVGVYLSAGRRAGHEKPLTRPGRDVGIALVMRFCIKPRSARRRSAGRDH
jgi:hypothetical protein